MGLPSPLKSLFVPPYALQGQEFSCHLTWPREESLSAISIQLASELEIVHVYNTAAGDLESDAKGQGIRVKSLEEPGYLGFVVRSRVLQVPETKVSIRIGVASAKREEGEYSWVSSEVALFRPELSVAEADAAPHPIRFIYREDGSLPIPDRPITLENVGRGTCIVLISVSGEGQIKLGDYLQHGEAKTRFRRALEDGLQRVKRTYPAQEDLLERLRRLVLSDLMTEEEAIAGLRDITERMSDAESEDPEFAEDIGDVFGEAALSIMSLDQRFTSWATAMGADLDRRLILMNPWFAVDVRDPPIAVRFSIRGFDVRWRELNKLAIGPIELSAEKPGLVPVCAIFQAKGPAPQQPGRPGSKR